MSQRKVTTSRRHLTLARCELTASRQDLTLARPRLRTAGEERVNRALARFLKDYAFSGPPYRAAADLVRYLRAEARPEEQELITDLFERITGGGEAPRHSKGFLERFRAQFAAVTPAA